MPRESRGAPMSLEDQRRWWDQQHFDSAGVDNRGVLIDRAEQEERAKPQVEAARDVRPMQPKGTERSNVVDQEKARLSFLQSQEVKLLGELKKIRASVALNGREVVDIHGQLHNLELDIRTKEAELLQVRETINQINAQSGKGARQERGDGRFAA